MTTKTQIKEDIANIIQSKVYTSYQLYNFLLENIMPIHNVSVNLAVKATVKKASDGTPLDNYLHVIVMFTEDGIEIKGNDILGATYFNKKIGA